MFKKNFRLISMKIKSIYVYGNINNLKKLINYLNKEKIRCYYLENIKVKDKRYIIRRIIDYIKLNNIDAIYILDNTFLDFSSETVQGWGYCVFGQVIEGMNVVDKIAESKTSSYGPHQDVPTEQIIIDQIVIEKDE